MLDPHGPGADAASSQDNSTSIVVSEPNTADALQDHSLIALLQRGMIIVGEPDEDDEECMGALRASLSAEGNLGAGSSHVMHAPSAATARAHPASTASLDAPAPGAGPPAAQPQPLPHRQELVAWLETSSSSSKRVARLSWSAPLPSAGGHPSSPVPSYIRPPRAKRRSYVHSTSSVMSLDTIAESCLEAGDQAPGTS